MNNMTNLRPTAINARVNAEKQYLLLARKEEKLKQKLSSLDESTHTIDFTSIIGKSFSAKVAIKKTKVQVELDKVLLRKSSVEDRLKRYNERDKVYVDSKGLRFL